MSTSTDPAARVQELAAALTAHRDAYYQGTPKVSDFEYDQLEDELRTLLTEHPDLAPDPNPLEQVGAPSVLHAPVRHERPMLSLEKATTPEQVEAFMARFPRQQVVVMPKLDGLSLSIIYEGGKLRRAATRGDGTTGEDVTPIARQALDGIPNEIPRTERIEVRGEAVMLRSTFAAYNAAHPDKPLVNPRNGAAGTLRQKDASTALDRRLSFFAFDITPAGRHRPREGPAGPRAADAGHGPRRHRREGGRGDPGDREDPRRLRRRPRRGRRPARRTPRPTPRPARAPTAHAARSRSSIRPRRRRPSCAT